jgi:malate dehydrogenase (oxaloacetate-decarboxylating)(NADP+)
VVACESKRVPESMFFKAARVLADQVTEADLEQGRVYPSLKRIREVSAAIALAVAEEAYTLKLARKRRPKDLRAFIEAQMYQPRYEDYVRGKSG